MEEKLIKVRALTSLYYNEKYHRAGDVLLVPESYFDATNKDSNEALAHPALARERVKAHERIMERVADDTPERITSSGEALAEERRDTLESRAATRGLLVPADNPTGAADVLGAQLDKGRKA